MEYFAVIAFFLFISASTNADGSLGNLIYAPRHSSLDYYSYPKYAFEYAVRDPHTGDNKAQWEKRDGDVVIGAYSLVEPDGSLRVVEYRADDKTGFNAVVKRIGPNIHPVATPIYKASIPSLGYKSYVPQLIGSVAGIEKLSSAPIYNGAYIGSGTSSGLLQKTISPTIIKEVNPILPLGKIIAAPISVPPIYNAEIITEPIYKEPIYKAPIYKAPIYQQNLPFSKVSNPQYLAYKAPIIQESYRPAISQPQISKSAPLLPVPIYSPYLGTGALGVPATKNLQPIAQRGVDYNLLDKGLYDYQRSINYKAPLNYKGVLDYNVPLIYKGNPGLGYN